MKLWLLLGMISFSAYAQDGFECVPAGKNPLEDFSDLEKHLEWHGATAAQIEKAACKTLNPPSSSDLDKFIASKAISKSTASAQVHGVNIQDDPLLIEAFKKFTTAKDGFGFSPTPELQKDFQKTYNINPECQKVRCAMEKIWGKGLSEKILYLNLKHNYNASEFAFENSDRFSETDLDDILMGLEDLPPHLIPMGSENQRLTHFKKGYTLAMNGPGVVANAVIMLFDVWDTEPRREKQYTIFHEVSHNTSTKLKGMDESPEWLAQSSWIKTGDTWTSDPNACQVTKYGATNPWEDFAEAMSTYRYNPQDFKTRCPKKYEFIKNSVFKGIEYTDVKSCSSIPEEKRILAQKKILDKIKNSLQEETFTTEDVAKTCKGSFSYPVQPDEIKDCSALLMMNGQASANSKVSEALKEANIPDTQANQDQILQGMSELIANDAELKNKITEKAKGVPQAVDAIIEKSIADSLPKGMGNKDLKFDDYTWKMYQEKCLALVVGSISREELTRCHVNTIITKDKESQRWNGGQFAAYKAPSIFKAPSFENIEKKRDLALEKHLVGQETTKKAMLKIEADAKESLNWQHTHVSVQLYEMKGWKQLSPEEFCSQTYAKGSISTSGLGIKVGDTIPSLQEWCVKKQSESKRRYEFKDNEWAEFVDSRFK
jgi:hypothetical protein